VWLAASATFTLNENVPDAVGVPLSNPLLLDSVNPPGKEPDDIDQVYGAVPPLTPMLPAYALPPVPDASDAVVIVRGEPALAMVTLYACEVVLPEPSATFTENVNVPDAEGVPANDPLPLDSVNPPGKEPDDIDQVYGAAPPVTETLPEYAVPTVPDGSEFVVIVSGGFAITMLYACDAVLLAASVTFIVKL
jgi:hypothetical protein